MKETWVYYDLATGAHNGGFGGGDIGASRFQDVPEGMGMLVVPREALAPNGTIDHQIIKAAACAMIDRAADQFASGQVNNTPRQMAVYAEKEAEARRVIAGDPGELVFLPAEAEATGIDLAALAAEVIAQADQWRALSARIEAARRKAKLAVQAAEVIGAIAAATQIDWNQIAVTTLPAT